MKSFWKKALVIVMLLVFTSGLIPGAFALSEQEPNDSIATATEITVDSTVEGIIAEDETEDYYRITPEKSGRVTVNFTSHIEYYRFIVKDAKGDDVFNSKSQKYNEASGMRSDTYYIDLEARTYYFKVDGLETSWNNHYKGPYEFTLSFEDAQANVEEPNDSQTEAKDIGVTDTVNGIIALDEIEDYYRITPEKSGRVTVNFTSHIEYYRFIVKDAKGDDVFNSKSQKYNEASGMRSDTYYIDLEARTYYFKVDGLETSWNNHYKGPYEFTLSFEDAQANVEEPNDSPAEAKDIGVTDTVNGIIALDETEDYYRITPEKAGRVTVDFTSHIQYYRFIVLDKDCNEVFDSKSQKYNETSGMRSDTYYIDLEARTYYFKVDGLETSWNNHYKGLYSFTLSDRAPSVCTGSDHAGGTEIRDAAEPTCTEPGYTGDTYCLGCGELLAEGEEIPATGHSPVTVPGVPATCTEPGLTDGEECSVCGTVLREREEIPATGHRFGEWKTVTAATTLSEGEEKRVCSVCGAEETRETPRLPVEEYEYMVGDLDFDGVLSAADARLALRLAIALEDADELAADGRSKTGLPVDAVIVNMIANADGFEKPETADAADARAILRAAISIEPLKTTHFRH
ncbi:MAG: hypothetical protein K6C36_07465 [Clostridia bacterium]|nr:hypothetical protein [Clostridia bacterium]